MKTIFFYCLLCFLTQLSFAQETPKKESPKVSYKTVGSIIISTHKHSGTEMFSGFLNFGGPAVRLDYGKCGISYGMFPSLRFVEINNELTVSPTLGTGFQLNYKKFALALPMYYLASPASKKNIWIISVGVGYKF
ncbi:MAG: hypothetical protein HY841_08390 [Bacteroidetes bacterium]|nr:hypothetical protein [Bacteroidota bacterium]